MGLYMKTTIELPDDLFIEAKKRAAELRRPLRSLIEEGLRAVLNQQSQETQSPKRKKIRWVTSSGGITPGIDPRDRSTFYKWLNEEFKTDK